MARTQLAFGERFAALFFGADGVLVVAGALVVGALGSGVRVGMNDAARAAKLPADALVVVVRACVFFASSSSSVFGQSPRIRRESERSARSLPSVWHVGQ